MQLRLIWIWKRRQKWKSCCIIKSEFCFAYYQLIVNIIIAYKGVNHEAIGSGSSCNKEKTLFDSYRTDLRDGLKFFGFFKLNP